MAAFIDSHTHLYLRGSEELQAMARAGVRAAALCAYVPVKPSGAATLLDLFRWLVEKEPPRFEACGLRALPVVGIHPRCIPAEGLDEVLEAVDRLLAGRPVRPEDDERAAVALGEVGLDLATAEEKEVLKAQLKLASARQAPVVVHTPRKDKVRVLGELLAVLEASEVDPATVVIDHLTVDLVGRVRERGFKAGLTVQPGKLSVEEVVSIVRAHGPDGLLVDSDAALEPADVLAVPKVAKRLEEVGFDASSIARVSGENAAAFFALEKK
ncbi:MAG: TatD family hydrolase [Myxococcales bacterium]